MVSLTEFHAIREVAEEEKKGAVGKGN